MLHESIKKSIPEALKAHDEVRLRTLRNIITTLTNEAVAKKQKPDSFLDDESVLAVIKRLANQRKDSIEQFEKAGRSDLVGTEQEELVVLESYLPQMMSQDEIRPIVEAKITELGIFGKQEIGKLTGMVMKDLKGKAEGSDVKAVMDALLS